MATVTVADVWPELLETLAAQTKDNELYHGYYDGEQNLPFDVSELKSIFGNYISQLRDNLARPVIEIAEGRVRVRGFQDSQPGNLASRIWRRNNLDVESRWVHTDAMVLGTSHVIVEKKNGKARIYPQVPGSCAVVFDPENPREKLAALKHWVEWRWDNGGLQKRPWVRVNIYFKNRVVKFRSKSETDVLNDSQNLYEQIGEERHGVGEVPVFPFIANFDNMTGLGRSDLKDAIGPIDGINKTIMDMLVASEYTAAPQRYATGVEIPIDPQTGEPMEAYKSGANRLWTAPNEQARFGQFPAADLSGYKTAVELLVNHLASNSATPHYAFSKDGEAPAGEALKTAEVPLRQRVADHQEEFGASWNAVMAAAVRVEGLALPEDDDISELAPDWLPVNAPFFTREFLEELKVKGEVLGVPEEMLWRESGYTKDEIEEMKAMREEQAALGIDVAANLQAEAIVGGAPPTSEVGGLATDTILEPPNEATGAPQ